MVRSTGKHTNVTGFSAIGAGYYDPTSTDIGGYKDDGKRTYWWSTTKGSDKLVDKGKESPKAYPLGSGVGGLMYDLYPGDPIFGQTWVRSYEWGLSIRCVKQVVSVVK